MSHSVDTGWLRIKHVDEIISRRSASGIAVFEGGERRSPDDVGMNVPIDRHRAL